MKIDLSLTAAGAAGAAALAARAERSGYDGVWAGEVTGDPFVSLALACPATARVGLGTAVAVAFARNPMSLAVTAHDLHTASGGRLLLGLGTQVRAHVTRRFAMPWSRPAARIREYVAAVRAIWDCWATGDPLRFEGEFYRHTLMPPAFRPEPHGHRPPPILLAGVGAAMTAAAGAVADGFFCHGFTSERYVREVTVPALRRARPAGLAGFELVGAPLVATGRTEEELAAAVRSARGRIAFYASTPAYRPVLEHHGWGELGDELHGLSRAGRWAELAGLVDDDVLHAFAVVGEPARIAPELLARFGDLFTRCSLSPTAGPDPAVLDEIAAGVRTEAVAS